MCDGKCRGRGAHDKMQAVSNRSSIKKRESFELWRTCKRTGMAVFQAAAEVNRRADARFELHDGQVALIIRSIGR